MASSKHLVLLSCCVVVAAWSVVKAEAPGLRLIRQFSVNNINLIDEQIRMPMRWSHGGYFVVDRLSGQPPVIYTLDRDGNWTDTAQFHNSESTFFSSHSFDRQSDGTIVFSGTTYTDPHASSPFLAWTSSDGKVQRLLHLDHYMPFQVAVAPDDTIWTLGFETVDYNLNDPAVNKEAHVLRHFNKTGELIWSGFPQSRFNRYQQFHVTTGVLAAADECVGWYGSLGEKSSYTEVPFATMSLKEYPGVPSHAKYPQTASLVITKGGVASVSIDEPNTRTSYILDRTTAKWMPVNVPPMGGYDFTPHLIGSDGDNLVFKSGREAGFFTVSPQ